MKKILYTLSFLALTLFNCANNSEDDLIDTTPIDGEKITYKVNIKPIIDTNCIFCHNSPPVNGAPTSLLTFQNVFNQANSVLNRISLQAGQGGAMPVGGPRLPQASIDLFQQWIIDGRLEE